LYYIIVSQGVPSQENSPLKGISVFQGGTDIMQI